MKKLQSHQRELAKTKFFFAATKNTEKKKKKKFMNLLKISTDKIKLFRGKTSDYHPLIVP